MKAAVLYANEQLVYDEYPIDPIQDDEVLIRVRRCGICGSDIPRVLNNGAHYYPIVLGHEFSGDVVEVGKNVTTVKPGIKASVAPLLPCGKCPDCQKGNYSLCKHYKFIGSSLQGGFAEYVRVPATNVVPFADEMSYDQGALFEPATVALHGLFCNQYQGGGHVAVVGGGNIGLFTAQWCRIFGARSLTVFDIDSSRFQLAHDLGVDNTICTRGEEWKQEAAAITDGQGFDYVFEAVGAPATIHMAFELAANKAHVCMIGTPKADVSFTPGLFEKMNRKEFLLTGSWMSYSAPFPGREWALVAHYFATGDLKWDDRLIFAHYPLEKAADAFALYKIPGAVGGKILLDI